MRRHSLPPTCWI